ncbi:MAG: PDZ domain-containing protein [Anaerolineae bacterium]|nr:PDZ domain-containing protein [Anaerolineae bacterium]
MSKDVASSEFALPESERRSSASLSWLWTILGGIILAALAVGGIAGFMLGRWYERVNGPGSYQYQDTYWLLGAALVDRGQSVSWEKLATGGPADMAGIKEGDRLVAIDGQAINTSRQARNILAEYGVGSLVSLTVERKSRVEQYDITLGYSCSYPLPIEPPVIIVPPPQPPDSYGDARLGVYYRTIQPDDPFAVSDGALIITVWPGSPAEAAGLEPSDIITRVGSKRLTHHYMLNDALDRYAAGNRVSLDVWDYRTGNIVTLSVILGNQ